LAAGHYDNAFAIQNYGDDLMRAYLAVILALGCLSGCAMVDLSQSVINRSMNLVGLGPNEVGSIGIMALSGASSHAFAVEVAFAYGDAAMAVVVSSDVSLWFKERDGFCRNYANQLDVIRVELPAGYSALLAELPEGHQNAQAIFVFAEALGKADLTEFKAPWVIVSEADVVVQEAPPGAESSQRTLVASVGVQKLC